MPLFFFLSGMCYSADRYTIREFNVRRLKTIMYPCMFLTFFVVTIQSIFLWQPEWRKLCHDLPNALWFLPIMYIACAMGDLILRLRNCKFCFIAFFCLFIFLHYITANGDEMPYRLHAVIPATLFYITGFTARNAFHQIMRINRVWITSILITILIVVPKLTGTELNLFKNVFSPYILCWGMSIIGILVTLLFSDKIAKIRKKGFMLHIKYATLWMGRNSLVIMGTHQIIRVIGRHYFHNLAANYSPIYTIPELVLMFVFSIAICHIINNHFPYIIGKNK